MPTNMPPHGWHPAEYELADLQDAWDSHADLDPHSELGAVSAHVAECPVCRAVLTRAGTEALPTPERVAAGTYALDSNVLLALVEHHTSRPAAGQVWRLRAPSPDGPGEVAGLVAVVDAGDDVLVAPFTSDAPEQSDMWVQHLQLARTEITLGAWVSLATRVGLESLDVHVADVDPGPLVETWRCLRRGETPPTENAGTRALDAELRSYREQLRAGLGAFAAARLVPQTQAADEGIDARTAIVQANWAPSVLARTVDTTPGRARKILQGLADLTAPEIETVAAELGTTLIGGPSAVPGGKLRAVATPMRRHRFEVLAEAQGLDGWLYRAEQCHFTLAARASKGTDSDW